MSWDEGLDGPYRNIAAYEGRCLRVRAGPGTGKTFALMRRIAKLLEEGKDPNKILAVTFTKAAARDIIKNLLKLQITNVEQVQVGTLHSIAFKLLSQRSVFDVTGRHPRPLNQFEIDCLISDLSGKYGGKNSVKSLLLEFEAYWATLQHLEPGWPKDAEKGAFQVDLRDWLIRHEGILIGELIPIALEYIKNNPTSVHAFRYDYVLVDEYQDLNKADQVFIDSLARNGQITVIGDENQSIYGFRHAHPEGIIAYKDANPDAHDENLDECKRCPKLIVAMANSLISHNTLYRAPVLKMVNSNPDGTVHFVQHDTIYDEGRNIAAFIDNFLNNNPGVNQGDIIILSSRRKIGYLIRDSLLELGRGAKSFYLEEALEKQSAKEGFCVLTLLVNPKDKIALRAWLCIDKQHARTIPYNNCLKEADEKSIDIVDYLEDISKKCQDSPADFHLNIRELLSRYSLLKSKIIACQDKDIPSLIDFIWPPGDVGCEDIRGLAIAIAPIVHSPKELLDELSLAISQPELISEDEDIIRIMSLHKSKGLTAKCVVIAGCVAGAIPQIISEDLPGIQRKRILEEQRRLFYVAITRTTDTLVISHSAMSTYADAAQMKLKIIAHRANSAILQASPFLAELGDHRIPTLSGRQWKEKLGF
ncbi:MAG: ATP-dependent helicase [Methanolinea sp.]|jgi:superfamily I DNA/RNA helicase|nr:ATP-dependent helicase [Methanolinea sp.]